jgi:hypothetical protein
MLLLVLVAGPLDEILRNAEAMVCTFSTERCGTTFPSPDNYQVLLLHLAKSRN